MPNIQLSDQQARREDGRTLRGERTRARFIEATRSLMRSGSWRPPAPDIAKLSGNSTRSVFQHFAGMHRLYEAALADRDLVRLLASRLRIEDLATERQTYVIRLVVCGPNIVGADKRALVRDPP